MTEKDVIIYHPMTAPRASIGHVTREIMAIKTVNSLARAVESQEYSLLSTDGLSTSQFAWTKNTTTQKTKSELRSETIMRQTSSPNAKKLTSTLSLSMSVKENSHAMFLDHKSRGQNRFSCPSIEGQTFLTFFSNYDFNRFTALSSFPGTQLYSGV